jgi:hypothetical protein
VPSEGDIHLGLLTATPPTTGKGGKWTAEVSLPVHNDEVHTGALSWRPGATVSGHWDDAVIVSCVTDYSGSCSVSKNSNKRTSSVTFTVTDVSHSSYDYVVADNDGASDITVDKPDGG